MAMVNLPIRLETPTEALLPAYIAALQRGWTPDHLRGTEAIGEHLQAIAKDPGGYISVLDDPEARAPPIRLPDGTYIKRLPSRTRWIFDDDFAGLINLRWQSGTPTLPEDVLGHIGFSVVPWRQNRGYAKHALALMLYEARAIGLPYVDLTTQLNNVASQQVIVSNGGSKIREFSSGPAHGHLERCLWRIKL